MADHRPPQPVPSPEQTPRGHNEIVLPESHGPSTGAVINRIEDILHQIQLDLLHQRDLSIPYRSRRTSSRAASRGDDAGHATTSVRFPGSTAHEAKKFARLLKLLQLIHDGLVAGTCLTKRNIYYQDVELFGSQSIVDDLVDDLAFTLDMSRADLNVAAAAKGLVAGSLVMHMHASPYVLTCSSSQGLLIPPLRDIRSVDFGMTK
ncbi:Spo11/DNA topoisomerase VI subunit A [Plectosphaerella plurivora]|uniref:Spo11/DNA topoisomerase VI subunit A n=1 Tax=Plectosphaerella plurivora TaxID=936078 RepID=A0A9P9ADD9_9PEZI|nr:Spo11/DNA topoisomerase VI subunit A [Plectosphaerella plurivora]